MSHKPTKISETADVPPDGSAVRPATLYIVATPIGNLGDMVPRAVEVLQSVDFIVAEDTRHSRNLLDHFLVKTPLRSFHEHSGANRKTGIIERILSGDSVALVTDAGTPLISDPGYSLVRLAHEKNVTVVPIPGACALTVALSVSGLPTDRFWFEGFLPAKKQARQRRMEILRGLSATVILYEAPHRIVECFRDIEAIFGGDHSCCLARELTKQFETIKTGQVVEILDFIISDTNQQRGEIVVLLAPVSQDNSTEPGADDKQVLGVLLDELPPNKASALAARITGRSKRELYDLALNIKQKKSGQ